MLPSSNAASSAGLKTLVGRLSPSQVYRASNECFMPPHRLLNRNILCLRPSWSSKMPMIACSTVSSGHPYSAKDFMATWLQPYSHCIIVGQLSLETGGKAGVTGMVQVEVGQGRQGCPLNPILFGLFFDDPYSQLQSECPSACILHRC